MKLLLVAGGGGHFAPALALIESLPKDVEVLVVGRKYAFEADKTESLESQTAKKLGIPFISLITGRLQRKITPQSFQSLLKVPVGYFQAIKIVKQFRPDVVLSFGGYVSLPVAFAAQTFGIPIIVHEQILGAGLANKIVAKFAKKVCVSWKESARFFPEGKVVITGNPMRRVIARRNDEAIPKEIAALLSVARNDKKNILYITGGSGGAHALNVLIEEVLEKLLEKFMVIHQTGGAQEFGDFERLEKKKNALPEKLQKRYVVTQFVQPGHVASILQKADLVVSRSGINTVTELLSFGKPCLLIPLPYGQHNEQLTNALFVKQTGIAEVAEQKKLTGEILYEKIVSMNNTLSDYQQNSNKAKKEVIEGGVENLLKVVNDVNEQKKKSGS